MQARCGSSPSGFERAHPDPLRRALSPTYEPTRIAEASTAPREVVVAQPGNDFVARDKYVVYATSEIKPVALQAPLRSVFTRLLHDHTSLFAGRDQVVASIDRFLRERSAGYLVVSAPPGYGKTALMAYLVRGWPDAFAYHFFAPLYAQDSTREAFFLRSVVEQMAAWHADHRRLPSESDLPQLRALFQTYMHSPMDSTRVLILDDVDQVTDWELTPYLGGRLSDGLHVIVTTRDASSGLDQARLALPYDQTDLLQLHGLRHEDVREVLVAAGGQAATCAMQPGVLAEIVRIAALDSDPNELADPLYLRFLAEDLRDNRLTPANLAERPRGLNRYFQAWYASILRAPNSEALRSLCATLASARGPLDSNELQRLHPDVAGTGRDSDLDAVLGSGRRFLSRDAEGRYSLAHPRLKEYLRERIDADDSRLLVEAEQRLLAVCEGWRERRSGYALRFYSHHLLDTALGTTSSSESARSQLFALVDDEAWLAAQLSHDPSGAGYLSDVARAWQAAAAVDSRSTQRDESAPLIARELWCVLAGASLRSLSHHVPIPLLTRLASAHSSPGLEAAVAIALQNPDPVERCDALATLAEGAPEAVRDAVVHQAVASAHAIVADVERQALAFARVARLDLRQGRQLASSALNLAQRLPAAQRVRVFAALLSELDESERLTAFGEALEAVEQLTRVEQKARGLIDLAPGLPAQMTERVLQLALALDSEMWTTRVLAAIAPRLGAWQLARLIACAHRLRNPSWRAHLLEAIAQQFSGRDRTALVQAAVAAARLISDPTWRLRALASLADALPADQAVDLLDEARAAIRALSVTDHEQRARALIVVASHMPASARRVASLEAWQSARLVENPRARAEVVAQVARLMPLDDRDVMVDEAFSALEAVPHSRWRERNQLISGLAPVLGPDRLVRAVAAARAIGDGSEQVRAVAALCTGADTPQARELLSAATDMGRTLHSPRARVAAMTSLVPALDGAERDSAIDDVLNSTVLVDGDEARAQAITAIAPHLAPEVAARALDIVSRLENEGSRAHALCALVPQVGQSTVAAALEIAHTLMRSGWRAEAIASVASRLSDAARSACLAEVRVLAETANRSEWRFRALTALANADYDRREAYAEQALVAASESASLAWRVRALAGLTPFVSVKRREEVLRRAIAESRLIPTAEARSRAMIALIPLLDAPRRTELLDQVVPVAAAVEPSERRVRLLSLLAPELAGLPRLQSYPIFKQMLRMVAARGRREVLLDVAAVAPVVRAIGGNSAAVEIARYILALGRRWP